MLNWYEKEHIFKLAKKNNMTCFSYGSLAQGLLSGKYNENYKFNSKDRRYRLKHFSKPCWGKNDILIKKLREISVKYQKSIAQCAIRWVMDNQCVDSVIVGAKTPAQIDENLGVLEWQMYNEDFKMLKSF